MQRALLRTVQQQPWLSSLRLLTADITGRGSSSSWTRGFSQQRLGPPPQIRFGSSVAHATAMTLFAGNDHRLSNAHTPTHYALTVKTDLDALSFEGHVVIDISVHQPTSSFVLNAVAPLKISRAVLTSSALKTSSRHESESIEIDNKLERATIKFGEAVALQKGQKAKLALSFSSELDSSMMGYYRSAFEVDGKTEYYSLTQFEPTSARRAFPCWDEPAIKATFAVTLISKKGTVSISNMPAIESFDTNGELVFPLDEQSSRGEKGPSSSGDWTVTRFETTPKVSSYLVAYANGPFEYLESSYKSPLTGRTVPLRVYATKDGIHQAKWALEVTENMVPVYERLFDIPYPLPKLDTLAASDFDSGAMENWGLITGRTSVYLFDEQKSGLQAKKRTAGTQSHEIAHQWFGNIVTMQWWDNLWLNEAFATLMGELIALREWKPEWRLDSAFINVHHKSALNLDGLRSSHPIEVPIEDAAEINQLFDRISYAKGGAVLKMLSSMVGEEVFLAGVSIYLKNHLYGNSRTEDLWKGIAEASGLDIAKMMSAWTLKIGFPVLTVEETNDGLKIRQNRFLATNDVKPEEDETLWYIPLELKTVDEHGKSVVDHEARLEEKREIAIPLKDAKKRFYKLNAETTGLYRVNYSPERLAQLGEEAARTDSALSVNDRMGLVQDAHVLAKSGYGSTSGSLNFLNKLSGETENYVWQEIDAAVGELASVWWEQPDRIRNGLDQFRRNLVGPVLKQLGFEPIEGESSDAAELRRTAVSALSAAQDPKTIAEIQRRFEPYMKSGDDSLIPNDLLQVIFIGAVKYGGEKEYEKVLSVYKEPPTPHHKIAAMLALCYGPTAELRQRTLDMLLSGAVKDQDFMYFFAGMAANRKTRRAVWEWFTVHFDDLKKRFKGNQSFEYMVKYATESFTSHDDSKAIEAFFKDKNTKGFASWLTQSLEAIGARAKWLERAQGEVEQWLQGNGYLEGGKSARM